MGSTATPDAGAVTAFTKPQAGLRGGAAGPLMRAPVHPARGVRARERSTTRLEFRSVYATTASTNCFAESRPSARVTTA